MFGRAFSCRTLAVALISLVAGGCAQPTLGLVRFRNAPVVWLVNDRLDTPVPPKTRDVGVQFYSVDAFLVLRVRGLSRAPQASAGINSLGEVPDSTWFTNRIGRFQLNPEQIAAGPMAGVDGPQHHFPWTILSSKPGGASVGFVIEDALHRKYILKFDVKGLPEMETAAAVIANRALWACGYNVPEESLAYIQRQDLVVSDDAVMTDAFGATRSMKKKHVDKMLENVDVTSDGRYRVLLSRYVSGKTLGGFSGVGMRSDDPNDVIPHSRRRDVRGLYPIFAWLNQVDVKDANTLDTWIEHSERPGRHYLMHYLIDFGKALGTAARIDRFRQSGFAHSYDLTKMGLSLLSLGIWKRPWDDLPVPELPGVGLFESERFVPDEWQPAQPYAPFDEMNQFDGYWAAKIIARLNRGHIEGAVGAGQLSSPQSRQYMVQTLVERQRKTMQTWFEKVAPLDEFELTGAAAAYDLCFDDLLLKHGLQTAASVATEYEGEALDASGAALGWHVRGAPKAGGRACVRGLRASTSPEGYTMVKLTIVRGKTRMPPIMLHLAIDPATNALRLIGIERG